MKKITLVIFIGFMFYTMVHALIMNINRLTSEKISMGTTILMLLPMIGITIYVGYILFNMLFRKNKRKKES